jgi:hypothetical protein
VPPSIRSTLYKTIFTDIASVSEEDFSSITWEMMKEINNLHEDEVDDLQYFIHRVTEDDIADRCLVS